MTALDQPFDSSQEYLQVPENGDYVCCVRKAEMADSKKGHRMLAVTFQILEGPFKGAQTTTYLNIQHPTPMTRSIAQQELAHICRALSIVNLEDTTQLVDGVLRVTLEREKVEPGEQVKFVRPKKYASLEDAPQAVREVATAGAKTAWA